MARALGAGADDAPRLAGMNLDALGIAADPPVELVLEDVGVTVAPVVVELAAATREPAALVHLDDLPRTFQQPFDAATAPRLVVLVEHGRDHELIDVHRAAAFQRNDVELHRVPIEVAEIRRPTRLGVSLHYPAKRSPMRKVLAIVLRSDRKSTRLNSSHIPLS